MTPFFMTYVFEPAPPVSLPVAGTALRFPVRRIYCVGRNYAAHAVEMGHDPDREPPFFFQKNPQDIVLDGRFRYPRGSRNVHHEIELVAALRGGGADIATDDALDLVFGYALGLDMTRRDLQGEAKTQGRPWEIGKAFDDSAPCGPLVPATQCGHPDHGAIWLDVNGGRRQSGDLNQLIWKLPQVIAKLSALFTVAPGDLIFTGSPAGVAAVERGDHLHGHIDGIGDLVVDVV